MSQRDMWKMLHLIYNHGRPGLSGKALRKAGITCLPDTIDPLVYANTVEMRQVSGRRSPEYYLSKSANAIMQNCIVANKRNIGEDLRVDEPHAFVIMPFSEKWSSKVFSQLIRPATKEAGLKCTRGDTLVRVGDLTSNIWREILRVGVIIADISSPNVNVFYELGLVHAIGKDVILLKRKDAELPADFGGAHYYEYSLESLPEGKRLLLGELKKWKKETRSIQVKALGK